MEGPPSRDLQKDLSVVVGLSRSFSRRDWWGGRNQEGPKSTSTRWGTAGGPSPDVSQDTGTSHRPMGTTSSTSEDFPSTTEGLSSSPTCRRGCWPSTFWDKRCPSRTTGTEWGYVIPWTRKFLSFSRSCSTHRTSLLQSSWWGFRPSDYGWNVLPNEESGGKGVRVSVITNSRILVRDPYP